MGTRADFYEMKDGEFVQWLGSIAWDGYDIDNLANVDSAEEWPGAVAAWLKERDDATFPKEGWPWPWKDSNATDYAYWYDPEHGVVGSGFGQTPHIANKESSSYDEEEDEMRDIGIHLPEYPDMSSIRNVKLGSTGSGLLTINTTMENKATPTPVAGLVDHPSSQFDERLYRLETLQENLNEISATYGQLLDRIEGQRPENAMDTDGRTACDSILSKLDRVISGLEAAAARIEGSNERLGQIV